MISIFHSLYERNNEIEESVPSPTEVHELGQNTIDATPSSIHQTLDDLLGQEHASHIVSYYGTQQRYLVGRTARPGSAIEKPSCPEDDSGYSCAVANNSKESANRDFADMLEAVHCSCSRLESKKGFQFTVKREI
jgi:hypothetical protein